MNMRKFLVLSTKREDVKNSAIGEITMREIEDVSPMGKVIQRAIHREGYICDAFELNSAFSEELALHTFLRRCYEAIFENGLSAA